MSKQIVALGGVHVSTGVGTGRGGGNARCSIAPPLFLKVDRLDTISITESLDYFMLPYLVHRLLSFHLHAHTSLPALETQSRYHSCSFLL